MIGPHYILMWCTAVEGLKVAYYSDSDEGRAALKQSLGVLSQPHTFFVRVYCEDTLNVVDRLAPKPA